VSRPHFLIYFDGVVQDGAGVEALGDDWGDVEGLAMYSADREMKCDRLTIEKVGTTDVRHYLRNKAGIWYRENE
jgi:hypothetical protein